MTTLKNTRRRRGQTLPLACVSLLFMAVMMMLSFNITNVIHEKIRLQNYSDAQAFSMGTIEARAFNFLAYSNRSSAAAFVTIASLHGFYAIANMSPQLLRAAAVGMGVEALAELAVCIATWGSKCCDHIPKPTRLAIQYGFQDARDADDTLKDWEDPFNDAIDALWQMVNLTHMEQELVLASTAQRLMQGFDKGLKSTAKLASPLAGGVGGINTYNLYCSTEGSMADLCSALKDETARAKQYTEIIDASRPKFSHHVGQMGTDYLPFIGNKWSDLNLALPAFYGGDHAIADDSCSLNPGDDKGELACGDVPFAGFFGIAEDLPGPGAWAGSEVYSDESGGDHSPSGAHDGDHDKFKGIPKCVQDKECFINFRADKDNKKTWGQPSAFAYYQQDLTERPKSGLSRPWLLGDDGKVTIEAGADFKGKSGELVMKPNRTGAAMSRALVYFHAPSSWPRQPNFFDPFWHSKLHPFDKQSAEMVLMASGDKTGDAPMAAIVMEGDAL
jgi:hypothetical protein